MMAQSSASTLVQVMHAQRVAQAPRLAQGIGTEGMGPSVWSPLHPIALT